jgi:hypothetical protein
LAETKVAILLISTDFLNSEFIATNELPSLLQAAKDDGVLILPVIVRPCLNRFKKTPTLEPFAPVNKPEVPISTMSCDRRETLWDALASRIDDFLKLALTVPC